MIQHYITPRAQTGLLCLLLFPGILITPAAAQETNETSEAEDDSDLDLDGVIDASSLQDAVTSAVFMPFRNMAGPLIDFVATVLTTTPSVHPNPSVEDIHHDALVITFLLSSLGFMVAGLLHMVGPILGISYQEVRWILPRLTLALAFATVSLPLLQLAVEFTNALSAVFEPANPADSFQELMGLQIGLVVVWLIQSTLLLAVVVLFLLRDIYIIFVAAISPILALLWSLPRTKPYADAFIGGWFAALAIAPLDLLVLKLSLSLMDGAGTTALQSVSNWVFGIATLALLLIVPKQVWDTSQTAIGGVHRALGGLHNRVRQYRRYADDSKQDFDRIPRRDHRRHKRNPRYRERRQRRDD